jgi:uncharacterized membrane protein (DUF2068 family)
MMKRYPGSGYFGFKVIGTLKLISGAISLAAGIGILHYFDKGPGMDLEKFVSHLGLDPQNHFIHTLISRVTGIDRAHLRAIEAGTFLYALLHLLEGIGLILERDWAGYLVIVATSSLIPFELYEIARKLSSLRIAILVVNLAIVCYLIAVLRAERRNQADRPA